MIKIQWYGKNSKDPRLWLEHLMKRFQLTRAQVAKEVGVHHTTVDRWLMTTDRKTARKMPTTARILLKTKAERGDFGA